MVSCIHNDRQLNRLRLDGKLCDVNIHVKGGTFRCHRVVLASASKVLDSMFDDSNDITLPEIDAISFEIILESIYSGDEPILNTAIIYGLLRSSDLLGLQSLHFQCIEYVLVNARKFPARQLFDVFHLACFGLNEPLLKWNLSNHLIRHLEDFVREDFFVQMAFNSLKRVLEKYHSCSADYEDDNLLLEAIVRWVLHSYEDRRKFLPELIQEVNFNKITTDVFVSYLKPM